MTELHAVPPFDQESTFGALLQRVAIIAPHPDDETIGAGYLIQRVIKSGGAIRALFITDGEANPWPLRVAMRRWRIDEEARREWAAIRREEALRSLRTLGVAADKARFLSLPDQRLMSIPPPVLAEKLFRSMCDFHPTMIVAPSKLDLHVDHRAVSGAVHLMVATAPFASVPQLVTYVVHGQVSPDRIARLITPVGAEFETKRRATLEHRTQLMLSRTRFLNQSAIPEQLLMPEHDTHPDESFGPQAVRALRRVFPIIRSSLSELRTGWQPAREPDSYPPEPGANAGLPVHFHQPAWKRRLR